MPTAVILKFPPAVDVMPFPSEESVTFLPRSAEVSGVSGEKKQSMSGNLNAVGDPLDGYFNTESKTFEEAAA